MIHPHTEMKRVNQEKGLGVFATSFIPKGTVTYAKDPLEIEIKSDDPRLLDPCIKEQIETYSYIDENGVRIISWDIAKYVNHCCHCNTMSTGYGFEIAIKDIHPGDEITDEYGMFNFNNSLSLSCDKNHCRQEVHGSDLEKYYKEWDQKVMEAIRLLRKVEQPLANLLSDQTRQELRSFLETGKGYRSVLELKSVQV